MRVQVASKRRAPLRSGFTLIELLVVISIIAVLASLILPGVQSAREAARRTQCTNNMRNVNVAIQNYATDNGGGLPPLSGGSNLAVYNGVGGTPERNGSAIPPSWAVYLLPYLEQQQLFDRLTDPSIGPGETFASLASVVVEAYTCPDDPADKAPGSMSFVVNGGNIANAAWVTPGDTSHQVDAYLYQGVGGVDETVTAGSGVFWREQWTDPTVASPTPNGFSSAGFKMTMDRVSRGDGLSQTIFISENMESPNFVGTSGGFTGFGTDDLAFGLRVNATGTPLAVEDNGEPGGLGLAMGATTANCMQYSGTLFNGVYSTGKINDRLGTVPSTEAAPRPSSYHPSIVNISFGDGSGRTLSQNVDEGVYARLVSSNGGRYGQPVLSSTDF